MWKLAPANLFAQTLSNMAASLLEHKALELMSKIQDCSRVLSGLVVFSNYRPSPCGNEIGSNPDSRYTRESGFEMLGLCPKVLKESQYWSSSFEIHFWYKIFCSVF